MRKLFLAVLLIFSSILGFGQNIPKPMSPPRLVNDFAGMLTANERQRLEQKLRIYHDTTTTQIYIVSITSTDGYALAQLSPMIIDKWGIGWKDKNNGVLILLKPKTVGEAGEVFIGTGYGMEGVLPDAYAKRIIEQIIIPNFKNGNTYQGLDQAVDAIIKYALGEYQGKPQTEEDIDMVDLIIWLLIFVILFFILLRRGGGKGGGSRGGGIFFLPFFFGGGGGGRSGGGFGGFGGGGGGRSGGGGAGGHW
jgi:uncharacterized protein